MHGKPGSFRFFPGQSFETSADDLLRSTDSFLGLRIYDNIVFEVKVPVKNQPKHYGADDVPSDEYIAAWDGITLYVAWRNKSGYIPRSGGHIVTGILSDALVKMGDILYNQACEPNCTNQFMHTTLICLPGEEGKEIRMGSRVDLSAQILDPNPNDLHGLLKRLAVLLDDGAKYFATFKNLGNRLAWVESLVRTDTDLLLNHYYEMQNRKVLSMKTRVKKMRETRSIKTDIRLRLARVWLGLSNIETLRRAIAENQVLFENDKIENKTEALFEVDYRDDLNKIQTLDTERLEAMALQVSERLDSGAVVSATTYGALAGGFAGGALGVLANFIS
jgi:hypothetical protein